MSCNQCNCNCDCNSGILFTSTVAITGGNLVVTLPAQAVCNNKCVSFVITTAIPSAVPPVPVVIAVGTTQYKMINHCANAVYSDQLRSRRVYSVRLKTDTLLATNQKKNLLCTVADIPCIPATTAPAPSVESISREVIKK